MQDRDIVDIRIATKEILEELQLADRVEVSVPCFDPQSVRYYVDLTDRSDPPATKYLSFSLGQRDIVIASDRANAAVDSWKPFILPEILKLFPNAATHL